MPLQTEAEKIVAKIEMRQRTAAHQAERMPHGNPMRPRYDGIAEGLAEALRLAKGEPAG